MKKEDLKQLKLPLTKNKFILLRKSIINKRIKWMDMSRELMFSYLDYWKSGKINNIQDTIQD